MNTVCPKVFSILFILLLTITEAHAYVDPGSGSVIVTTILGLFAAIGYTCRKYFYKLRRIFSKNKTAKNSVAEEHQTEEKINDDN